MVNKRIFVLLALALILLPVVSAGDWFDFDNYQVFVETDGYGKVEIYDWGLFKDTPLAEYELLDNTEDCRGGHCYAIGTVEFKVEANLFDRIDFEDLRTGEDVEKDVRTYIGQEKEVVVKIPILEKECYETGNKSIICKMVTVGYNEESRTDITYEEYHNEVLPIGEYYWRIEGDVEYREEVDWIMRSLGEKFEEWAIWSGISYISIYSETAEGYSNDQNISAGGWIIREVGDETDSTKHYSDLEAHGGSSSIFFNKTGDVNHDLYAIRPLNVSNSSNFVVHGWIYDIDTGFLSLAGEIMLTNGTGGRGKNDTLHVGWAYRSESEARDYYKVSVNTGGSATIESNFTEPRTVGWHEVEIKVDGSETIIIWDNNLSNNVTYTTYEHSIYNVTNVILSAYPYAYGTRTEVYYDDITFEEYTIDAKIITALLTPVNNTNLSTSITTLNATFTPAYANLTNATAYIWYINGTLINTTIESLSGDIIHNEIFITPTLPDGTLLWNVVGCAENINGSICDWATNNFTFNTDTTAPILSMSNITNLTTFTFGVNSTIGFNATDNFLDACWYATSDDATNNTITCDTTNNIEWATAGTKTITFCANDTLGNEGCTSEVLTVAYIQDSYTTAPTSVSEGQIVTFNLWVNSTDIPTTTAYLYLNNSVYGSPTETLLDNSTQFTRSVTIPIGWGSTTGQVIDYYWNYSIEELDVSNQSTSNDNISVYAMSIDDCSSYGEEILNIDLRDEETGEYVNASLDSNIEIEIEIYSSVGSWNYSNSWSNENNVSVCVPNDILNFSNYTIDFTIGFDSIDRVWEFFYLDNGTLDGNNEEFNSLTNKNINLYDLATADSTSFLFNYFNEDGLFVDDVIVHLFRKYIGDGLFKEVERSKQNDDGDTIVHLVEEDVIYYFTISQNGTILFNSNTYTALCQTTPCEIQLEESGGFQEFESDDSWDLIDDGAYTISMNDATRTVNMTYSLSTPSAMNLTVYALDSDGDYSTVDSLQSTSTSGSLIVSVPMISGNTSFFASVYQDGTFKKSLWVDFEDDAGLYFGNVLSLFLGAIIILTFGLIAVTNGAGTIIFLILGMFVAMVLGLVDYRTSTGLNILIYLIIAGALILWKITRRNR